ncbi:MAG: MerR family transcriptional regulator [Clostridia bacterium]|nr:MerR family transcriptional regulator [Clostridia bacterium]
MKMQIKKFAELTGVSVRTLHYYDEIGLLKPSSVDRFTGYRYYDESSVLRMQEILFYRELDFSLKSIAEILSSPNYDREKALKEQKKLLTLKKERLERLILSIDNAVKGENVLSAFDNSEFEAYKSETKEKWGNTKAYAEFSEKTKDYSKERFADINTGLECIFRDFAELMKNGAEADSAEAQALVKKLQDYITENYYTCTDEILKGLGKMYIADDRFKNNIDKYATSTAEFASQAIYDYTK